MRIEHHCERPRGGLCLASTFHNPPIISSQNLLLDKIFKKNIIRTLVSSVIQLKRAEVPWPYPSNRITFQGLSA